MLAGVDIGSTGLKVSIFSDHGERLRYAYREYVLEYQGNDRVVFNPEMWWNSFCSCVEEIAVSCDLREIKGLGVSHANSMVLTDESLAPLFPAIMQLDKRGSSMVPVLAEELGNDRIFEITGNNNAAGFVWGPTLKWLMENESELYHRTRHIFNPSSYLVMRLTGVYCMDHTRAATTMLYNIHAGEWDPTLCQYFHLAPEVLPRLCCSNEIVGETNGNGGLPAGIPVVAGAMDTMAAVVGLASGKQENALILGSVGRFVLAVDRLDRRFLNTVMPDRSSYASMTPVNNAGIAVRWIRNLLFNAAGNGGNGYDLLNRLAAQVPAGSDGLMFFPYLNGASCPNWDSSVRGSFSNLEAFHEARHFARAVFEGVGYTLAESLLILQQDVGISPEGIYCGGGGAKSDVWPQILSDIFGQPLIIPEHLETETIGCAILAGQATGVLPEISTWNRPARTVYPDPQMHAQYQDALRRFVAAYPLLRSMRETLS